jgi:hypothetical protein
MDSALQRIAEVAEVGGDVPSLRLMTAPAMIYGKPIGSRLAAQVMAGDLAAGFRDARRPKRGDRDRVEALYERLAQSMVAPVVAQSEVGQDALSIVDARVIRFDNGTTFDAPLIRVPISSITAWFVGTFKVWKSGAAPVGSATPPIEPPNDLDSRIDLQGHEF